jgi:beta-lactamase superfamily II metal-dependent hydrolase
MTTVEVRMYHVGFGDAFRVTVRDGRDTWRMLVDCGVHPQGQARPISESVKNIIADLVGDCGDAPAHLDVVVATHHHQDHISGFAEDDWSEVQVDQVWVPFVEDLEDADGKALRRAQTLTAQKLDALITARQSLAASDTNAAAVLAAAKAFVVNSSGNAVATNRLLNRDGVQFANRPQVRFLPYQDPAANTFDTEKCGVRVHILGPPRDPNLLKKMNPPTRAGWLTLNLDADSAEGEDASEWALFNRSYTITEDQVPPDIAKAKSGLRLSTLSNDSGLLAAASILERSVNNTSVFFLLDVHGVRLLFPGDAQEGGWEHVLNDQNVLTLIKNAEFYKVGHHGSHNATPKPFVLADWQGTGDAMVPWGLVKAWKDTIPKKELLAALTKKQHRVILPKEIRPGPGAPHAAKDVVQTEWWSQLTFTVAE